MIVRILYFRFLKDKICRRFICWLNMNWRFNEFVVDAHINFIQHVKTICMGIVRYTHANERAHTME